MVRPQLHITYINADHLVIVIIIILVDNYKSVFRDDYSQICRPFSMPSFTSQEGITTGNPGMWEY